MKEFISVSLADDGKYYPIVYTDRFKSFMNSRFGYVDRSYTVVKWADEDERGGFKDMEYIVLRSLEENMFMRFIPIRISERRWYVYSIGDRNCHLSWGMVNMPYKRFKSFTNPAVAEPWPEDWEVRVNDE